MGSCRTPQRREPPLTTRPWVARPGSATGPQDPRGLWYTGTMTTKHVEIERKYDVGDDVAWVDVSAVEGVAALEPAQEFSLTATYYDTDARALARAGITLRRRTGGSDAGWTLKLPAGGGDRSECEEPLGDDDEPIPDSLLDLARAWVRDHDLRPVATLRTRRTVHRLIGESGAVLAEACDDVVTAQTPFADGSVTLTHWREWEIELVDGPVAVLDAAGKLMRKAGAAPSPWSSKLERALDGTIPSAPTFGQLTERSRAGDVLHAHLAAQADALLGWDGPARHDEPDGVHKMRVATRRIRSALGTFRRLVDREVTDPLRDELKWIAGVLGEARDAEVLRERLLAELSGEPDDLVMGPIAALIEAELRTDHRKAHERLVEALDTDRYFRLLDRVDALVADPPFTPLADGRADKVITRLVLRAYKRVERLVKAGAPASPVERDHWYHEIRKAAKRLRYAGEAVEPAFGAPAHALAEAAENLQEVLGEHQDSVVARQALRDLGARIHLDGENAFTIGRLHALEQTRADEAAAAFGSAWQVVADKHLRSWLRH